MNQGVSRAGSCPPVDHIEIEAQHIIDQPPFDFTFDLVYSSFSPVCRPSSRGSRESEGVGGTGTSWVYCIGMVRSKENRSDGPIRWVQTDNTIEKMTVSECWNQ